MTRKRHISLLLLILFLVSIFTGNTFAGVSLAYRGGEPGAEYVQDELLVRFKPAVSINSAAVNQAHNAVGAAVVRNYNIVEGLQLVKLPKGTTVEQAITSYRKNSNVLYAEPNYIYRVSSLTPNDPYFLLEELWGLDKIKAPDAWEFTTGSDEVIIAVIDTGVYWSHPDLADNIWINPNEILDGTDTDGNGFVDDIWGWDFYQGDNNPMDEHGHGTHVAGTIAAVGNNDAGITGVMWNAKIMPLRFLGRDGSGTTDHAIAAIGYANNNGAHIINNSWGGGDYSQALKDAICASSAVVVCAAGNQGDNNDNTPAYPASYNCPNIISVAATNRDDNLAWFSNYGATSVDVAAPGIDIYSSVPVFSDVWFDSIDSVAEWVYDTPGYVHESWGFSDSVYVSAPYSLRSNPFTGSYQQGEDSHIMTANSIRLPDVSDIKLVYKVKLNVHSGDGFFPFISLDGVTVLPENYLPGYSGYTSDFVEKVLDISNWADQDVWIGFNLYDMTQDGNQGAGVWVDDVKIEYLDGSDYVSLNGTSMATPHVSGLAGLIKAASPGLTNLEIKHAILNSVDAVPDLSDKVLTGGRINAFKALDAVTIPVVETYSPADGAADVPLDADLVLTFSENVIAQTAKNIIIKKSANNSIVETIAADEDQVTVSGSTVTINPQSDLEYSTGYYVTIDAGAFTDGANNDFAGITDTTTWNFTTITDPTPNADNSGITNQVAGADGSKQVTLTVTVRNAAGTGLTGYTASNFSVTIDGGTADTFNNTPFSDFTEIGGGVYTVIFTGAVDAASYSLTDLTVDSVVIDGSTTVKTPEAPDTEPPTVPANPVVASKTTSSVSLTWSASTDNVGVDHYVVQMKSGAGDWANVGTSLTTSFSKTSLSASTTYVFRVKAIDAAGNASDWSGELSVTTDAIVGGGGGGFGGGFVLPVVGTSVNINAETGGTVSYGSATLEVPAGALPGDATMTINTLTTREANNVVPEGLRVKLGSDVYEITTSGSRNFGDKTITIKIAYDLNKIVDGEAPIIKYYDEAAGKWVELETTMEKDPGSGKWFAVTHVNHLTKFAVFIAEIQKQVKDIRLTIGRLDVTVNGEKSTLDAEPYIDTETGRTLVPIRFISETLGANVDWNAQTRQVTIKDGSKEIVLTIGSRVVLIDGVEHTIDCVSEVSASNRTFVPLRFIGEALGAKVDYNTVTKQITIIR